LAHAVIVHLRECAAGRVNCKFFDFLQLKVFCKCRKCVTNLHAVPPHAHRHEQEPSPQECLTTERDAMSQSNDSQTPMLILAFSAALMALSVSYSVDAETLSENTAQAAPGGMTQTTYAAYEPPTLAPSAIVLQGVPAFRVEQGMVKLFFAPSKTDIPLSAESALQDIVAAMQNGQRVQISGFHDETGNAQQNIALSKKRAEVVQKRLISLGAPAQAIALKKPAATASTGNHAEARRVEVTLLP